MTARITGSVRNALALLSMGETASSRMELVQRANVFEKKSRTAGFSTCRKISLRYVSSVRSFRRARSDVGEGCSMSSRRGKLAARSRHYLKELCDRICRILSITAGTSNGFTT